MVEIIGVGEQVEIDLEDLHPEFDPVPVDTGLRYTIIPLVSQRALARVSLDLELAHEFERRHAEVYPCAFTGRSEPWMEARGLFPFAGIAEDPATGSAAGPLAAYMAREGVLPIDEERVVLQGAQIGRPSYLTVAVSGAPDAITDVRGGGRVHRVLQGELYLPD